MSFQSDFYAWLSAQSGVTAIVSTRIYPLRLPQEATYPALRFERDSETEIEDFGGQGGLNTTDIQIDAIADTHAAAITLADAVKAVLLNYRGTMGSTVIRYTRLNATFDAWDESIEAYRVSHAWTFSHN